MVIAEGKEGLGELEVGKVLINGDGKRLYFGQGVHDVVCGGYFIELYN